MTEIAPVAGFFLGLAGSVHCVAMCGGVASALDRIGPHHERAFVTHGLYALGRLSSYAALGAAAGFAGSTVADLAGSTHGPQVQLITRLALGTLLIAFGATLAGFPFLRRLETFGRSVWKHLKPLARPLAGLPGPLRSVGLGALWGFLPCGMVYGALAVASLAGSSRHAAEFMIAFGAGTLPAVLATGLLADRFWRRIGRRSLRRGAALAVSLCGVWVIVGPLLSTTSHATHAH